MHKTKIYREAVRQYGLENQIVVAIEEMSELQKELCKYLRSQYVFHAGNMIEEIADVEIMLEQLISHLHCRGSVDIEKHNKIERLAERLGMEANK